MNVSAADVLSEGLDFALEKTRNPPIALSSRHYADRKDDLVRKTLLGGVAAVDLVSDEPPSRGLKRKLAVQEKVVSRRVRFGPLIERANLVGQNVLENSRIQKRTRDLFHAEWPEFIEWCEYTHRPHSSVSQIDGALASYAGILFFKGEPVDTFVRALYGTNYFQTHLSKPLQSFVRAHRALKGWKKREPGHSRPGLPYELACLVALGLHERGLSRMGACLVIHHDMYMRPSELLTLKRWTHYTTRSVKLRAFSMPGVPNPIDNGLNPFEDRRI